MQEHQPPEIIGNHKVQQVTAEKAATQVSPHRLQHPGTILEAGGNIDASAFTHVHPCHQPSGAATPIGALVAHVAVSSTAKPTTGQSPVIPSSPLACAGTAGLAPFNPLGPYSPFTQRSPIRAHQADSLPETSVAGIQPTSASSENGFSMPSVRVPAYNPFQQANNSLINNIDSLYKSSTDTASAIMPTTTTSLATRLNPFPTSIPAAYSPLQLQQQQQQQNSIGPMMAATQMSITSLTHPSSCSTVHESAAPTITTTTATNTAANESRTYPEAPNRAQGATTVTAPLTPATPDAIPMNCPAPIIPIIPMPQPVTLSECNSSSSNSPRQVTASAATPTAAPAGQEIPQRPTLPRPAPLSNLAAAAPAFGASALPSPPTDRDHQLAVTTTVAAAAAAIAVAEPAAAVPGTSPQPSLADPPQLPTLLLRVQPLDGSQLHQRQQQQGLAFLAAASAQGVTLHPHPQHATEQQQQQLQQDAGEPLEPEFNELQRRVEFLMEMVGGCADASTCRDVLAQVDGDMERASHIMVELYCGGAGGGVGALASAPAYGVLNEHPLGGLHAAGGGGSGGTAVAGPSSSGPASFGFPGASGMEEEEEEEVEAASSRPGEMYNACGYFDEEDVSPAGKSCYPQGYSRHLQQQQQQQQEDYWEHWDQQGRSVLDGAASSWDGVAAAAAVATASGSHRGRDGAVGTWEECNCSSDPWVTTGNVYDTVDGGGGCGGGGADACGTLVVDAPRFDAPEGEGEEAAGGDLGRSLETVMGQAAHQYQHQHHQWQQQQQGRGPEAGAATEEKMEELRIYFPNLSEDTLRTHLVFFNGDVQQALQLLSELHEDEIYRRIEMERQAESDAALARRLAESASSPGTRDVVAGGYYSLLGRGETAGPEEEEAEQQQQLQQQVRCMAVSGSAGALEANPLAGAAAAAAAAAAASAAGASEMGGGAGCSGDVRGPSGGHWGLKLLVRMFGGGEVDEELLAEVLENQGGDVEAARSALRGMGLVENQMQSQVKQTKQLPGSTPARAELGDPGDSDPWFWSGETAISTTAAGAGPSSSSSSLVTPAELGAPLGSHRCPSWQERGDYGGCGLTGCLPRTGSFSSSEAFQSSSVAIQNQKQQQQQQQPGTSGSASFGRHGGGGGGGVSEVHPPQPPQPLGPIRILASLGVDYQELGFSEEALRCIRVAFDNSALRDLLMLQRSGANSLPEAWGWRRPGGAIGQPGRGLTHEEKQALWAQHRKLPLALKEMQEVLRRGARAASEAPGSKRLGQELLRA
ncbi:hypothetical protein VOLCADRAFT_116078, partial [Volvox carteri f. nagariensis]